MRTPTAATTILALTLTASLASAQSPEQRLADIDQMAIALTSELASTPLPGRVVLLPQKIAAGARHRARFTPINDKALRDLNVSSYNQPARQGGQLRMLFTDHSKGVSADLYGNRYTQPDGTEAITSFQANLKRQSTSGRTRVRRVYASRHAGGRMYYVSQVSGVLGKNGKAIKKYTRRLNTMHIADPKGGSPTVVRGSTTKLGALATEASRHPQVDASTKAGLNQLLKPRGMHIRTRNGRHSVVYNPGHKPRR